MGFTTIPSRMAEERRGEDREQVAKGCTKRFAWTVGGALALLALFLVMVFLLALDAPENAKSDPSVRLRPATQPQSSPTPHPNRKLIGRDTFVGTWPFSVDRGQIECRDPMAVYFRTPDGRLWPLNGWAGVHAERYGAEPSKDEIWPIDEEEIEAQIRQLREAGYSDTTREHVGILRINLGDVLDYGLKVCGFD